MKIAFVYNTDRYYYHKNVVENLKMCDKSGIFSGDELSFLEVNISAGRPLHEYYYEIREFVPDLIVTIDFAGFEFRTEGGRLTYNQMACKFAHILLNDEICYEKQLQERLNFQMFVYIPFDEDLKTWREKYPQIPNIELFPSYNKDAAGETEHDENVNQIMMWWDNVTRDLWLNRIEAVGE